MKFYLKLKIKHYYADEDILTHNYVVEQYEGESHDNCTYEEIGNVTLANKCPIWDQKSGIYIFNQETATWIKDIRVIKDYKDEVLEYLHEKFRNLEI